MNAMARVTNRAVFNEALLPEGKSRLSSFGAAFGLEFVAIAALVIIPLLMPQKMTYVQRYWTTPIAAPHIEPFKPQPQPKPKLVAVKQPVAPKDPPKIEAVEIPKPKIYTPVITRPVMKPVIRNNSKAPEQPEVAKVFPDPTPQLSLGSSAIPNLKKPREAVQTGGFGDPDAVPTNNRVNHATNINQAGAFDMPTGPGSGNGTGGAKGAKGVTGSAGFGNGVAVGTSGGGNHGTVQAGVFADEHAGPAAPKAKAQAAPNTTPLEVLFKPKPVYTDEGRAKKIEGDVVLKVVFTASGEVQVQNVVQGLGYGLDASAESCARAIRFRPATQDGHPIDLPATVHITFELAY